MNHLATKIFTNAFSGWMRLALQIVIFAFLTPFIIRAIGKEQYGLWACGYDTQAGYPAIAVTPALGLRAAALLK